MRSTAEREETPCEAADQEMSIAGTAFDRAEGMLDNAGTAAHQFARALHPRAMAFENVFMFPATDGPVTSLRGETTRP